jgi:hypothetical protein
MKRITRPANSVNALFGLVLGAACAAAVAGEPREPMPTEPTLYYACMSTGGRVEYDSAAFAYKNPGPVYRDHYELNVKMTVAFDAYLTQKYGFHGLVNCGRHNTLAEATKWLQGRASQVSSLGNQYKYTATDWSYAAAPVESAPATTTSAAATAPAGQTAASTASEPTTFYFCSGPRGTGADRCIARGQRLESVSPRNRG